jgi:hypothetical protein
MTRREYMRDRPVGSGRLQPDDLGRHARHAWKRQLVGFHRARVLNPQHPESRPNGSVLTRLLSTMGENQAFCDRN